MSENPYLSGNFAPVDGERTDFDLEVTGQIPRELSGSLLRIGPNPVDPDPEPARSCRDYIPARSIASEFSEHYEVFPLHCG